MRRIPKAINSWEKSRVAEFYIDELNWNLTPLKKESKDPLHAGDKRYELDREELLSHLGNGANIGLFPAGEHVVLDLDSKKDGGKSTEKFLNQSGPKVQTLPRERTSGGVHVHIYIKDFADVIRKFPNARKLVNKKVRSNVVGELFFGGKDYVVTSPSVHENGAVYYWEVTGDIPEWPWQEFRDSFGEFLPEKKEKIDEESRARQWAGDLKTLNIVALVRELDWYHGQDSKKPDVHHVVCPWASDHTGGSPLAAVFAGTGDNWPGFHCFHAHCTGRGIIDFLEQAEKAHPGIVDKHCSAKWAYEGKGSQDKRGRPLIVLPGDGRENDDFVDDVAVSLKDKEFWFAHGPDVVRVIEEVKTRTTPDGEVEACERVQLRQVTAAVAESTLGTYVATGYIKNVKVTKEDGTEYEEPVFIHRSIFAYTAKMLMSSPRLLETLPKIDRLLDIPIPVPVGKKKWILPVKGYNPDLHILVDQDVKLREVPVKEAKEILANIVADFPFADDDDGQSRCHWYARLITPMCRAIMGWDARLPMWVFMANRPGAGKDYLNGVVQTLYHGYAFEDSAIAPRNSEETEKRITSAHAAGRRALHFANQQGGYLEDQALIAGITSTVHRSRRLGSNDAAASVEYPNELEFSMSANIGLQWREDVTRRSRFIKLAYFEEDTNSRTFTYPDLHGYVRQNRELILSAIYSLIIEWKRQGCPPGPVYTSFPRWGEVVGGILDVCGLGNPCLPTNWGGMDVGGDPLADAMRTVFVAGHERHGNDWLDALAVRALVSGTDSVSDRWNGLAEPKDKEHFTRDLKVYNRRNLDRVTLVWKDPTKKLNKTKVRFWKDPTSETEETSISPKKVPETPESTGLYLTRGEEKEKIKNNLESSVCCSDTQTGTSGDLGYLFPVPFEYITDSEALRNAISLLSSEPKVSPLGLDIETYGPPAKMKGKKKVTDPLGAAALDPLRGSIRLLSLKSENSPVYIIDLDRVAFPAELKELLENRELVGHNLKFDLGFLKARFQIKADKLFDTMSAAMILTNGLPDSVSNALGAVIAKYLAVEILKDQGMSDWSVPELSADQLRYAAADVHYLLPLKTELERVVEQEGLTETMVLENNLLPAVIDLYLQGFPVDRELLQTMLVDAEQDKQAAAEELRQALNAPDLNINSNPQLLNAFAAIGLPLASTSKKLTANKQDHPAVAALIEYRKVKSAYTEKMESLLQAIRPDGRIHCQYNPLGTDTGRFSCKEPNVQQVPNIRKAPIRKAFRPTEGRTLIKLDYNQMELRAIACYTSETVMLEAYRTGEDLHRKTASGIFATSPEEVTKDQRGLGKTTNFGFAYGQGAKNFARGAKEKEGLDISLSEAEFYKDVFFKTYPKLREWHRGVWGQISRGHISEIRTPLGRRRLIPKGTTDWNIFTSMVNVPIQGGCADAVKYAIIELHGVLPEGTFLVGTLHDELIIETDIQKAPEIAELAKGIMEQWADVMFPDVPMLVEGRICESWG